MGPACTSISFRRPVDGSPAYLGLAKCLVEDVKSGRLGPGTRLPGTRTLSSQLGVSRNTVLAAYRELIAQGWFETRPASGTFVRREVGCARTASGARQVGIARTRVGYVVESVAGLPDLPDTQEESVVDISSGMPDNRLVPVDLVARAYRRVLRTRGPALLGYGDPRGESGLREQLAILLSATRGLSVTAENVLVTRGAQMALALAARLLLRRGDRVAVERYGYRPVWDVIRQTGAELVPIGVDEHGIIVDELTGHENIRAVYVTPHHQFPTMALLSADRRAKLLSWARRERIAVLEDDYDHEFHYRGQPVAPLMSGDRSGVVVYAGSLSKVLAPALRIGFLVGPRSLVDRAARLRMSWDRQGDNATEAAVAQLLSLGEVPRHVRKIRRVNEKRRNALADASLEYLKDTLEFQLPHGGMSVWAHVADGSDVDAWAAASTAMGVRFRPASEYDYWGRRTPFLRLSFAAHTPSEIRSALAVMARARRRLRD